MYVSNNYMLSVNNIKAVPEPSFDLYKAQEPRYYY